MQLSEAIDEYLLACRADGCVVRTVETYRNRLRRLREQLGQQDLAEVTTRDIRVYTAGLYDKDLSIHTVHGYIRTMKQMYNWLEKEKIFTQNPVTRIKLPKLPDSPPKAVSDEDAQKMIQAARATKSSWEAKRNLAILLFLADTGCRLGGLLSLNLSDIDLELRLGRVQEKGDRWRFVFLRDQTIQALEDWLEAREEIATGEAGEALWVAKHGGPLSKWGMQSVFRRLKERADVSGPAGAHSFRHRFAVNYLLNGGDMGSLADILGHKDIETTKEFYARFKLGDLQRKHDKHSSLERIL
jgi:integrase/recombinase XerD